MDTNFDFSIMSKRQKPMLSHGHNMYYKSKVSRDGHIRTCYYYCENKEKGCRGSIQYSIDPIEGDTDGMSGGYIDIVQRNPHDEFCDTTNLMIIHRKTKNAILDKALEGKQVTLF